MRILYVAMKFDYGRAEQGPSFEHENFHGALAGMGHEVIYFDFMTELQQSGREAMNRRLVETARREQPDLMFCCLFTDQFDFATIRGLTDSGVVTLNWFCDDHWRFEDFSRHWAPAFTWVATTASSALPKYAALGLKNVLKTQWACNHFQYRKLDLPLIHDVSFVGQRHGVRAEIIEHLQRAGIPVVCRGANWPAGRVTQPEMIALFNQSRINLNLANPSVKPSWWQRLRGVSNNTSQIKGRNFEVPGCGGFLLTDPADNLAEYYAPTREVAMFADRHELVERIRYYLTHEAERRAVAEAGWCRTLAEHTYEHRFRDLFRRMGLPAGPP